MDYIIKALNLASEYYSKKKFQHALRVADYAYHSVEASTLPIFNHQLCYVVGILHDLVEDTECTLDIIANVFDEEIAGIVKILTKDENMKYEDYIESIINSQDYIAYIVKKADIKDHLSQTETLTDKLKEKYYPIMRYFL